jgi:plastocyanin/uncharacterized membrane protein
MEQIWNSILEFSKTFITPDWAKVIALLPLGLLGLVALYFVWLFRRLTGMGPARRGITPSAPRTPEGIHMPGPSFAPIFAAVGMAVLLFGLVFGGTMLWLGLGAVVLTLLYWLREAMRDYDRQEATAVGLPAVAHAGPPPGVHMPGPSFRPLLASFSMAVLLFGLVFGGALLAVGLIMVVVSLVGWLGDARAEYQLTEAADRSGHLENAPAPHYPTRTLAAFAILLVVGVALNLGILPPGDTTASNGAAGSPGASSAAGGPSGGSVAPSLPAADVTIEAAGIQFTTNAVTAPADKPFTIAFANKDAGVPHNVAIKDAGGTEVFKGAIFNGAETRIYHVPALKAGVYPFACSVHANMTGTLTVK